MSTKPLKKGAKYADLYDVPERRIYAREGVTHAWLVDPLRRTLEVLALESGRWSLLASHEGRVTVRAVPFDAIELSLGALWRSR